MGAQICLNGPIYDILLSSVMCGIVLTNHVIRERGPYSRQKSNDSGTGMDEIGLK